MKLGTKTMEMNVKPLLLWDIAFPKEQLDPILNTLIGKDRIQHKKDMRKRYGFLSIAFNQLRKFLKLKPIPIENKSDLCFPIYKQNVEILPIGIKEDEDTTLPDGERVEGI